MRTFVSVCRVLVWIILTLTTLVQIGTILSISLGEKLVSPTLLIIATALMFISVIFFFALRRGKLVPLLAAAVAAVLFVLAALQLKNTLSVVVTAQGLAGVSLWKAMYRHMTPVLIPLCLFPIWWDYYTDLKVARLAEADRLTPTYFASADDDNTETVRKPKRSVRSRIRKAEDGE